MITIYTDGACKGNPGKGGWGAVLFSGKHTKEIYGGKEHTTNNEMELMAAVEALSIIKRPCSIVLFTDSAYLCNGMNKWLDGWVRKNWKTSSGSPVKNKILWEKLSKLNNYHDIQWRKVKGHSGDSGNDKADALANKYFG